MKNRELVIIGGGPGGYVSAIKASQMGMNVTLIERDELGGTCLNIGCIPTKALLHSTRLYGESKTMESFGVNIEDSQFCLDTAMKWKDNAVKRLVNGVKTLLKKNKVEVIKGEATFKNNKILNVNGEELTFKNAIIASGSRPTTLSIPEIEDDFVIYSEEALSLTEIPEEIVIIGGGVIGMELAGIFSTAGSHVTIVELLPEILPTMDRDLSINLRKKFSKQNVSFATNTKVTKIQKGFVVVEQNNKVRQIKCDKILVAVGREPNVETLGLENTDIEFDKKGIKVNDYMQTNVNNIYAIGDIVPTPQLAHVASKEGIVAVYNIAGKKRKMKYSAIPSCVYTSPEIASIGISEEEAKARGIKYNVGKFPLLAIGKAVVDGVKDGFIKIIASDDYDEVIGVHIMAPNASELIHHSCIALSMEATVDEFIETVYPHPTLGEGILEAALSVKGKPIHM